MFYTLFVSIMIPSTNNEFPAVWTDNEIFKNTSDIGWNRMIEKTHNWQESKSQFNSVD